MLGHSAWNVDQLLGKKVYGHNLIRLHHPDTNSYLYAGPSFEGKVSEIVLKRYTNKQEEELHSVILANQINNIWEITHFCKINQGTEFKTGHSAAGQNRVLLRHFNSGKILAISQDNLPFLQDYQRIPVVKDEVSRLSLVSDRKSNQDEVDKVEELSRGRGHQLFEQGQTERSLQGFSVGASRSRSGSSEQKEDHSNEGRSSKQSDQPQEDLFDFKVEDSFVEDNPEEMDDNIRIPSLKITDEKEAVALKRGQSHDLSVPHIEEPSLAPNDPPIIKKQPFSTFL